MPVMTRGKYKKIWEEFRNNPEAFCDICSKSFPSAYFLQVHNETFCHICPKSLPSAYFLEVHNRVFHQPKTVAAAAQIEIAKRQLKFPSPNTKTKIAQTLESRENDTNQAREEEQKHQPHHCIKTQTGRKGVISCLQKIVPPFLAVT